MHRLIFILFALALTGCESLKSSESVRGDMSSAPGWASVFQTQTTDTETIINILRPRFAELTYVVTPDQGDVQDFKFKKDQVQPVVSTVEGDKIHWKVDRLHIKNLKPGQSYRLVMVKSRWGQVADWRRFQTLDLRQNKVRFAMGSCMSDSHAFEHVRARIWDEMLAKDPDFIMLLGDQVYVDDFDFVEREKATEFDIWTRYIDSFRKLPIFQRRDLKPILAVWDDHDFGTNNSDRHFVSRKAAEKIFMAFFGGPSMGETYQREDKGIYFSFNGFGQHFLLMDNRYFRENDKDVPYAHWGKDQHQWFRNQLTQAQGPVWLANGGQFFARATHIPKPGGGKKQINESFIDDHSKHFQTLIEDIKGARQPVVFLSGDIHYSEIAQIEAEKLGYPTYEITSSPIHSYIFRSPQGKEESWLKNPRRLTSVKEHNFLIIESEPKDLGLGIHVQSFGVQQQAPYFEKSLEVRRPGQTQTRRQ